MDVFCNVFMRLPFACPLIQLVLGVGDNRVPMCVMSRNATDSELVLLFRAWNPRDNYLFSDRTAIMEEARGVRGMAGDIHL
jgi:hypothetical protein